MYHLASFGEENEIVTNLLNSTESDELLGAINQLGIKKHYAVFSSGTTAGPLKGYLISRDALVLNARAVNEALKLTPLDKWGASLPHYHIGGLAIHFRARLLGHTPVNLRPWNFKTITALIEKNQVTVISLVPAQLYDLVSSGTKCPACLRIVLIGGDFLGQELEQMALVLGWPIVKTFGMTEVAPHLCTGQDEAGYLTTLPIHSVKCSPEGQLLVKSQCLFSYLIILEGSKWGFTPAALLCDQEGYYPTQDKVLIRSGGVLPLGRLDDAFKSSGHLINLIAIKEILVKFVLDFKLWGEMEIGVAESSRTGHELVLYHTFKVSNDLLKKFQELIVPNKINRFVARTTLARTELGKFKLEDT